VSAEEPYGLRDYLEAKFGDIDRRLAAIEKAGPRAGAFGAAGTILGAVLVFVMQAFGVKSQ
jgi:hypothetical protein